MKSNSGDIYPARILFFTSLAVSVQVISTSAHSTNALSMAEKKTIVRSESDIWVFFCHIDRNLRGGGLLGTLTLAVSQLCEYPEIYSASLRMFASAQKR